MRRSVLAALFLFAVSAAPAKAQIDDQKRLLLEGGYEDGVGSPGPGAPYGFLFLNRPGAAGPGSAWRLALAPVYLDTELGLPGIFGSRTDLGLGFSGGGYAFGHSELARGDEKGGESFIGHGGGPSVSLYPRIGDIGPVPLSGVLRLSAIYTDFQRTARSDPAFEPPPDEWTGVLRGGLRLGGIEPGMDRGRALEFSVWEETRVYDRPAAYGFKGDRSVVRDVNLYWTRLMASLPGPKGTRVSGGVSGGSGDGIRRLTAYRLGGMLTQTSEFPLILPGYFSQEISARRYLHAWAHTGLPLSKRFFLDLTAAGATITPVRGTDAGGLHHLGVSAGVSYAPAKGPIHALLAWGYAPTALRGTRRGGHAFAFSLEYDFLAPEAKPAVPGMTRQQGLRWLLGR